MSIKTKAQKRWDDIILERIQDVLGVAAFKDASGIIHFVEHDVVLLSQDDDTYKTICKLYRERADWQTYMFRAIVDKITSKLCESFNVLDAIAGNIDTWEEANTIWP